MTKRLSEDQKLNRRPTPRACVFCHEKHLQCSHERPCKNCLKRDLGYQCRDVDRKKAKYLDQESEDKKEIPMLSSLGTNTSQGPQDTRSYQHLQEIEGLQKFFESECEESSGAIYSSEPIELYPRLDMNEMFDTTDEVLNRLAYGDAMLHDRNVTKDVLEEIHEIDDKGLPSNTSNFNSNFLDQEYRMLGEIMLQSMPSSPFSANTSGFLHSHDHDVLQLNSGFIKDSYSAQSIEDVKARTSNRRQRPFISLGFLETSEKGPSGEKNPGLPPDEKEKSKAGAYVSPLASSYILQSVYDIYGQRSPDFDYLRSYHELTNFLKRRFLGNFLSEQEKQSKRNDFLSILKLIASYRPSFISAHKNLVRPHDILFLEMMLQRSLIDCENLLRLNPSPTIIWRRTGEIVSISNDLLRILGLDRSSMLRRRTFIMELMYEDQSIVDYFTLFKSIAVGNLHLSIVTRCRLKKFSSSADASNYDLLSQHTAQYLDFCSVWTVKRDIFDIPMLIIGQFLPLLK